MLSLSFEHSEFRGAAWKSRGGYGGSVYYGPEDRVAMIKRVDSEPVVVTLSAEPGALARWRHSSRNLELSGFYYLEATGLHALPIEVEDRGYCRILASAFK